MKAYSKGGYSNVTVALIPLSDRLFHLQGPGSQRTYGTVTYGALKIGTYSEKCVPNLWLRQSE